MSTKGESFIKLYMPWVKRAGFFFVDKIRLRTKSEGSCVGALLCFIIQPLEENCGSQIVVNSLSHFRSPCMLYWARFGGGCVQPFWVENDVKHNYSFEITQAVDKYLQAAI